MKSYISVFIFIIIFNFVATFATGMATVNHMNNFNSMSTNDANLQLWDNIDLETAQRAEGADINPPLEMKPIQADFFSVVISGLRVNIMGSFDSYNEGENMVFQFMHWAFVLINTIAIGLTGLLFYTRDKTL